MTAPARHSGLPARPARLDDPGQRGPGRLHPGRRRRPCSPSRSRPRWRDGQLQPRAGGHRHEPRRVPAVRSAFQFLGAAGDRGELPVDDRLHARRVRGHRGRDSRAVPAQPLPQPVRSRSARSAPTRIFACHALTAEESLARYVPTYAYEFNDENAPELFLPPVSFPTARPTPPSCRTCSARPRSRRTHYRSREPSSSSRRP